MILPAALKATAFLLPAIYLVLWYKISVGSTLLLLVLYSCVEPYPILEGKLLFSILAVILATVLVPSLELGGDDIHTDESLPPFVRILTQVFVVRHTAAEGTCELIDENIDHCPLWDFSIDVESMNVILVVLNRTSLPEYVNFQLCTICAVMVAII